MKWLWLVALVTVGILAGFAPGCGPEKPYCPDARNGECIEPQPDAGGGQGGTGGPDGPIFIDA